MAHGYSPRTAEVETTMGAPDQVRRTGTQPASGAAGRKGFWPRRSAIMFDVGTAGIRACQLQSVRGRVRVRDTLRVELPADGPNGTDAAPAVCGSARPASDPASRSGPTGASSPPPGASEDSLMGERLARLIGQGSFSGRNVGVVLSSAQVQFHALRVPEAALHQPREALHQALRWEVARETRTEPQELEVRHWPLPGGRSQAPNIVAVALPTQRASAWISRLRPWGLRLTRLDVAPCAHVRLASHLWPPATHDLWCVLDLGRRHSTLTVALGNVPAYIRPIQAFAEHWIRIVSHALDVPPLLADHLLRTYGIEPGTSAQPDAPLAAAEPSREVPSTMHHAPAGDLPESDMLPGLLFGVLSETIALLIRDVERCLAYALQSFPESIATRVVLAGGGANLRGLAHYLEATLSLPCTVLRCDAAECGPGGVPFEPDSAATVGGALLDLEQA